MRYALIFERAVTRPPEEVVEATTPAARAQRLVALQREGQVLMAGPFERPPLRGPGGLVILDVASPAEAEAIATADPFVVHGTHRFRLMRWLQDLPPASDER